jgi:tRNA dimethylallyltransferase
LDDRSPSPYLAPEAYLTGPTAVGKSEVALRLAERRRWSILSVDSRQIYRRLDIGTAKPTLAERARVRHLLVDLLDPEETCSAGRYRNLAREVLREEGEAGRRVLAVGGAGLYWEALTVGLHPLPGADGAIRARHAEILATEGPVALHERLRALDPVTADRLPPGDRQRVSRALEIIELTGRPLSEILRDQREQRPSSTLGVSSETTPPPPIPVVTLCRSRGDLYRRIDRRSDAMMDAGLIDELHRLLSEGLSPRAPGLQTVGYREFLPHLLEGAPLSECVERFRRSGRRYAKRQETWVRHRLPRAVSILVAEDEPPALTVERVEALLGLSKASDTTSA